MRLLTFVGLAVALSACDGVDAAPSADLSDQQLVYGTDNRLDYYQVSDTALLARANATAAMLSSSQVTDLSGSTSRINTSGTLATDVGVCASEPFANQPSPASCTAFMVGPDTVATAGHCISTSNCSSKRFVFGFRMDSASSARTTVNDADVYSCASIVDRASSGTQDYAIVRVDRAITGRTAFAVRSAGTVPNGTPLVLLGHPSGLPIKIAGGATVRDNSPSNYFDANVDSYGGNSGSPVINANTLEVEGILVRGNTDYVRSGNCYVSNVCPDTGCPGWEGVTKSTLFAASIPGGSTGGGGTCTDDASEDNDTQGTGPLLTDGTYSNLQVCTGDDDWYRIDVPGGNTLTVNAFFAHADGDVDMSLWSGATRTAISQSSTDDESITVTPTTTTSYDLRVYGYQGAEAPYTLEVSGTAVVNPTCTDDAFEDNDSLAGARPTTAGAYTNLQICTTDDDWYAIALTAGDVLTASINFSNAVGDLDISLSNGTTQVAFSNGIVDGESFDYTVPATGTYYLRVYGYQGAAGSYDLTVEIDAPLTLSVGPTRAVGQPIVLTAAGATPGERVTMVAGRSGGTTAVPGCPGVVVPVTGPVVVGSALANVGGGVSLSRVVPSTAAGRSYVFLAVELGTCTVSNAIPVSF